jgi:hypothetical protein
MDAAASQQPRPLQMGAKGAYIVRLLMVGDSACGKTSLVLRFDQNVFSTKFVTTIGVDYRDKVVKVRFLFVPGLSGAGSRACSNIAVLEYIRGILIRWHRQTNTTQL